MVAEGVFSADSLVIFRTLCGSLEGFQLITQSSRIALLLQSFFCLFLWEKEVLGGSSCSAFQTSSGGSANEDKLLNIATFLLKWTVRHNKKKS